MATNKTPEQRARDLIDRQLEDAGWFVCDRKDIDLINHQGVAVREVIMEAGGGQCDYLLYVDRKIVGVLEAKKVGETLAIVHWQSRDYASSLTESQREVAVLKDGRLPFIYESTGVETYFTSGYDPHPRARAIFQIQKPETLARFVREAKEEPSAPTWRAKVALMATCDYADLRPAQIEAINAIEQSLRDGRHSRSMVQMATGAGKSRTAVTESYRLLRWGGFNRVLFLADRNNLCDQALREFRDFSTPDDGRKFTELYNVDKLTGAGLNGSSKVVISTIQRVFAALRGIPVPDEDDPDIDNFNPDAPVEVQYSAAFPPESFDLVIVDECHRSIFGSWRGVIEYFDAHVVGLTATPTKQAIGFFEQNVVSEYTYPQSVADGVNVDFEVYRIKTHIGEEGSTIDANTVVPMMDRRTRERRFEELDDEVEYTKGELDRSVQSKAQIRLVLETFRDRLFLPLDQGGIFPGRSVVPKTLIFAKDDNHAEEIVHTAREVFGKGNDFAAKITYQAKDPKALLQRFRNSPDLRIAVTVDMIATGTDVRPIECVFFMRDVRSRTYFEQMKGRGARTINDADFQSITPDAKSKVRFVIVDAVGVTEHDFVDASPLERAVSIPLQKLMERAANLQITQEEVITLGSRLARLERVLSPEESAELAGLAGMPVKALTARMIRLSDPDVIASAMADAPIDDEGQPDHKAALRVLCEEAVQPLAANPVLRQRIVDIRRRHDLIIDEVSVDRLLDASGVIHYDKARGLVESWKTYVETHKDEISLIHVLYSQPKGAKVTFKELRDLAEQLRRPPFTCSVDTIWAAYEAIDSDRVRHADRHTATDLIALVRYTLGLDTDLVPYAQVVEDRWIHWLDQQARAGVSFTDEQMWWLDRIKETIVNSAGFEIERDLGNAPFNERGGVDGAAVALGAGAQALIEGLTEALAA